MKCKSSILLYTLTLISVLSACMPYKRVSMNYIDFFKNKEVIDKFKHYYVFVHDETNSFKLQNPKLRGDTIIGDLIHTKTEGEIKEIKQSKNVNRKSKYEIHIYTKDKNFIKNPKPSEIHSKFQSNSDTINDKISQSIEIMPENILKIDMYAKNPKRIGKIILYFLLGILGFLLLLYLLLLSAIGSASDGGSDSGGSDGSGSDSGGGNGAKGCYIATMVYGDYDAPQVLVLRKFRDDILSNYWIGQQSIKLYYFYSPIFVQKFKNNRAINNTIRWLLNRIVKFLKK